MRRRAAAGAAVVTAVAAGFALLPGSVETPRRETTATAAAARPVPELPERFTSGDGTEYRRLAVATLRANGEKAVSVTVPVSGKPLDVAALCDGEPGSDTPQISVNGKRGEGRGFSPCLTPGRDVRPLVVPAGATEVTVTFDTTTAGGGCVREKKGASCVPVKPRRADWSLAVYEWTPPARSVEPDRIRAFPKRLGGMRLASSATDVSWRDHDFTLAVTSPGGKLGIEQLCTGELAGRMWFRFQIDGVDQPTTATCGVWDKGPFPMAMNEFRVPKGERVTITGKMGFYGADTNRPVRWSVGVYVKELV
ncbi:hypothetical protein GCM10022419_084950 [Nonomuraea rosea]|uniref:Uncharacterized protein n=1 Tax=Nonomuraea rosea TaxID=638574 RepID=A0ABP6YRL9_9ACTN